MYMTVFAHTGPPLRGAREPCVQPACRAPCTWVMCDAPRARAPCPLRLTTRQRSWARRLRTQKVTQRVTMMRTMMTTTGTIRRCGRACGGVFIQLAPRPARLVVRACHSSCWCVCMCVSVSSPPLTTYSSDLSDHRSEGSCGTWRDRLVRVFFVASHTSPACLYVLVCASVCACVCMRAPHRAPCVLLYSQISSAQTFQKSIGTVRTSPQGGMASKFPQGT